jgi:hypothetical protein
VQHATWGIPVIGSDSSALLEERSPGFASPFRVRVGWASVKYCKKSPKSGLPAEKMRDLADWQARATHAELAAVEAARLVKLVKPHHPSTAGSEPELPGDMLALGGGHGGRTTNAATRACPCASARSKTRRDTRDS